MRLDLRMNSRLWKNWDSLKRRQRELLLNLLQESVGDSKDITGEKTAALPAAGSYYGESSMHIAGQIQET